MKTLPTFSTDLLKELDQSYNCKVGSLSPNYNDKKLWMLIGQRKLIDLLKERAKLSSNVEKVMNDGVMPIRSDNDAE